MSIFVRKIKEFMVLDNCGYPLKRMLIKMWKFCGYVEALQKLTNDKMNKYTK